MARKGTTLFATGGVMLLRYAILSLLREEEMHGYRIKSAFEERLGRMWPLNFGQIYGVLKELKRRDLIVGRLESTGSHMGRWVYKTTAKGRRALTTWLARRPRPPMPARNEIFIRLLGSAGDDIGATLEQLERQECVYRDFLQELRDRRDAIETGDAGKEGHGRALAQLAVDATILQVETHLRWLRHCGDEVRRRALASGAEYEGERVAASSLRGRQRRMSHGRTRVAASH